MKNTIEQQLLTVEHPLFNDHALALRYCTFSDQKSPLKESGDIAQSLPLNSNLASEYAAVNATVLGSIDSTESPYSRRFQAEQMKEIIFDDPKIKRKNTAIGAAAQTEKQAV